MKLKKMLAGFVAAAMTVATMAVSAFATNVAMDAEYPGAWGCSAAIPKSDLEAFGGDVKVTLNVTPKVLVKDQAVLKPITVGDSWIAVETGLTSNTEVRKPDGFIVIKKSATTVSFVIDANAIASLTDNGLQFQVYNVTINSADLEAGSPEADFRPIDDKFAKDYTNEDKTYEELYPDSVAAEETEAPAEEAAEETEAEEAEEVEEVADEAEAEEVEEVAEEVEETEAAPAETEAAPAADTTTAPAATGNTAAATIAVVMVAAGAAALVSKRK
ncbi:MAG: hypothetical protein ACI4J0_02515 [Huintestinicola sp.]|uniref:hypothetical protein n=1 Tax=Huintestinicola sp. TaxID=2981661 RepID=UPI003F08BAB9